MLASVESTYTDIMTSVFSSTIAGKAWFASAAVLLALVQVLTAARIFGHLQGIVRLPHEQVKRIHRWSGRLAFLCTLPVAFHCIFILGFDSANGRTLAHSIVGSFVYGVFAVKIFFVHDHDHPRWTLPLVGGTLFAVLSLADVRLLVLPEVRFGVAVRSFRFEEAGVSPLTRGVIDDLIAKRALEGVLHWRWEVSRKEYSSSSRYQHRCTGRRR